MINPQFLNLLLLSFFPPLVQCLDHLLHHQTWTFLLTLIDRPCGIFVFLVSWTFTSYLPPICSCNKTEARLAFILESRIVFLNRVGVTLLNACFASSEAARKAKSCPRSCLAAASLLMSKGMSFQNLFVQLLHAFSDQFPPISSDHQNTTSLTARSECMYLQSAPRNLLEAFFSELTH